MKKLLVEIIVPAINEQFDVFIPRDVLIKELNTIVAEGVAEMTNGKYIVSGYEQLCLEEDSLLLNPLMTLSEYSVNNGMKLFLI